MDLWLNIVVFGVGNNKNIFRVEFEIFFDIFDGIIEVVEIWFVRFDCSK